MNIEIPKIDTRGARQIYEQAVRLAKIYCPEWDNILKDKPDEDDIGIVLLKLFSKLSETVIGQLNRIPEKHLLAFYDFIGIDHLPSSAAKAPLTLKLSEGSKEAFVPARTKVASSENPTVVFETIEPLTAINFRIKSAYSLNTWNDKYTDHNSDVSGSENGFYIFGGDEDEKPVEHILYLADDAFDSKTASNVTIKLFFFNYDEKFKEYFSEVSDGAGNPLITTGVFTTIKLENVLIPKTVIDGMEGNWLSFRPKNGIPAGAVLPEVTSIICDVATTGIIPDSALFNNSPVDVKKGFYPFGETPKIGDAFYIGCDEAFSKPGSTITLTLDIKGGAASTGGVSLQWEYWDGSKWTAVTDNSNNFTQTDTGKTIRFTFPPTPVKTVEINGVSSKWIRIRIKSGGYGEAGHYEFVKSVEDILKAVPAPKTEIANIISNARTEVINKLKGENITITDNKIDTIFPSFKINPGTMSVEFDKILLQYTEAIKNQLVKEGITSGFVYIPPTYNPPFINSLTIEYSYTNKQVQKERCKTYNNFEFQKVDKLPFKPFQQLSGIPAFYMGFEDDLTNKPVALYFSQKTRLYGETLPKIKEPSHTGDEKTMGFVWQYYSAGKWIGLPVEDDTDFFTKSGIVKFIVPSDISKKTLFKEDQNLYWIRVELKEGSYFEPPVLKGIFPNTVYAENAAVIKDEALGTSNGNSDQVFNFSSKPLLEGQVIEVKEPSIPSEDELEAEEGSAALRIIKNDSGDVQEVWVRWREVKTFVHSDSLSRHYIIDRVNGRIIFGDGIHGMIPPALPNNILSSEYKSGGGKKGNQKQKTITGLKTTIPNIDSVTNHDSSSGGRDLETVGDVVERAPHSIKNRGRAVTKEDFERLALEASPDVAKAKCISGNDEMIRVIIAPAYEDDRPTPEAALTDYVEEYLKERAFAPVRNSIEVVGPAYKEIEIETTLVPVSISESAVVADKVERRVKEFLNPIIGGQEGEGWNFGEDIYLSEVAAVIEDVEGVDYIKELKVDGKAIGEISFVKIKDNELPCVGEITVSLSGGGG